jgi:NADH dehydrogenase [ubiquinone] 1 alpha subcomplex assembly factor 7
LQKAGIYVKYEFRENNKSQVEKFDSDQVTLRWFKMYEQMLFEDFGGYVLKNASD